MPRENFVLPEQGRYAYANYPLPIPGQQTISQPLTVAVMTEALEARRGDKILEVGTGSGYQAAILSEIVGTTGKIITTEIIPELFEFAKKNLAGYENTKVICADGSKGYPPEKPYDGIIVTASAPSVPEPLTEQLKEGGRLVIPVGDQMIIVEKKDGLQQKFLGYYAFVPLTGKHGH
ncbi:MAG: protein-L-isoaspartate(D-aspartate) O-methyltransferase [archaeon GW2011_AR5]|nr:MAG: protein-L-isoaspartate(D-aspartate) O-methyltransferase [archaeon GW2011_AR5]